MNILFLFVLYPEDPNSSHLTKDLSDEFVQNRENVYVATIREKKLGLKTTLSKENGANILRVQTGNMFNDVSKVEKLVSMMTMNQKLLNEIKLHWSDVKFDLIVGTTPYMANATLIEGLKKEFSCPSFLILWDLFPQNAKDLGLIKNRFIFNFFKRQEIKNLKSFDYIGCMSKGNQLYVEENYSFIDKSKLILFPLWSKENQKKLINKKEVREKYGFGEDDFILVFGGNMGKPQALENIIELANEVKEYRKLKFLFVGQGTEVKKIKDKVYYLELENVIFKDFIPREDYEQLIGSCNIGLVSLSQKFTIPNFPSKSMDYLKLGVPILALLDDVSIQDYGVLLEKELGAGIVCSSGDKTTCKERLLQLYKDTETYDLLSINARERGKMYFNVKNNYNIISHLLSEKINS